jgi:hypothetical protein
MHSSAPLFGIGLLLAAESAAAETKQQPDEVSESTVTVCAMIEASARANALPVESFVRLIWQESRFSPDAVGPVTRSGARAQGIAQFMPGTAAERKLREPLDPAQALAKSAEFLAELRNRFGNFGLAAAAYNAGPQRASEFIAGSRDLPLETKHYVLTITGRSAADWVRRAKLGIDEGEPTDPDPGLNCRGLAEQTASSSKLLSQQRAVPSWCWHLHHPNPEVCGAVHEADALKTDVRTGASTLRALRD